MGKLIGLKKRQAKATGYSKRTNGPDEIEGLILEEGEEICSSCKGSGCHQTLNTLASTCMKCNGKGKLDWISNAMGVPKREHPIYGTSSYGYCGTSGNMGINGNICSSRAIPVSAPGSMYVDCNGNNTIKVFDGSKWREVI